MNSQNQYEYHNNSSEWGSYGYITLESIINEMKASSIYGKFIDKVPRRDLVSVGKRTIKEFNLDVAKEIKAIELEISPTLNLVLPPDFINYVRVSYINEDGMLKPIAQSNDIMIAKSYLQNNDGEILFNEDGDILTTDLTDTFVNGNGDNRGFMYGYSFAPNADLTKSNKNKFRLDRDRGLIQFNSSVGGKNVILEYISDGLSSDFGKLTEADIKINTILEDPFIDAIYYKVIKNNIDIPLYEKNRARKEYFNSKRNAKRRMNSLTKDEIIQAFSGASKWI